MSKVVSVSIFALIVLVMAIQSANGFNWREDADSFWAESCDWNDDDLSSKTVPSSQCAQECKRTAGCTHFSWTNYKGGTCWMKRNPVTKDQAITITFPVCGLLKSSRVSLVTNYVHLILYYSTVSFIKIFGKLRLLYGFSIL